MKSIHIYKILKHRSKHFVMTLFSRARVFDVHRRITGRNKTIFTFHRVYGQIDNNDSYDSCPKISVEVFQKSIEQILLTYQVVPVRELFINRDVSLQQAAITFDDGWVDNYTFAFPILQRFSIPATIFMTTGKIGSDEPFWQQKLGYCFKNACGENAIVLRRLLKVGDEVVLDRDLYMQVVQKLKSQNRYDIQAFEDEMQKFFFLPKGDRYFLNEQEIREMSLHGVEFGSHTMNHVILTNETKDIVEWELVESKRQLEAITRRDVDMISYPNGNVRPDIAAMAYRLGYRFGCSTQAGGFSVKADRMMLPRVGLDLQGILDARGVFNTDHFRWACR